MKAGFLFLFLFTSSNSDGRVHAYRMEENVVLSVQAFKHDEKDNETIVI
jgi:hypothetical protein